MKKHTALKQNIKTRHMHWIWTRYKRTTYTTRIRAWRERRRFLRVRLVIITIRVAVAQRLGSKACEPHTCVCGKAVDARGLHGLSCRRSAPRQQRYSHLNDILWRAIKRAQMPAIKEPINLMRDDNKRPDGTTLLPWARGKPMAWDVTVPDTLSLILATQQLNQVQQPKRQHRIR